MIIYKYPLIGRTLNLPLPHGAQPLSVQINQGQPQLWVLQDPQATPIVVRRFFIVGTGQDFPPGNCKHIDTFQINNHEWGTLVFHAFEELSDENPQPSSDAQVRESGDG